MTSKNQTIDEISEIKSAPNIHKQEALEIQAEKDQELYELMEEMRSTYNSLKL